MSARGGRGGSPQITFRAGGALAPELARRVDTTPDVSSMAQVAQRDLERLYSLLYSGRAEVAELRLSFAEACAICDALNGTLVLAGSDLVGHGPPLDPANIVALELHDADRLTGLGDKWGVDIPALIARLRTLTALGWYSLLDQAERFWRQPERETGELLREVGLTTEGPP